MRTVPIDDRLRAMMDDRRISLAAKGVLVFCWGQPEEWRATPEAITPSFDDTREGIAAALRELREFGYLPAEGSEP
jgi:hypothetical protein